MRPVKWKALGGSVFNGLWSMIKTWIRSGLGNKGKDWRPPASQSAVRLPEAHLHLQAEGHWLQSESGSDPALLDKEEKSPEGVAADETNNSKQTDNTNTIIIMALMLIAVDKANHRGLKTWPEKDNQKYQLQKKRAWIMQDCDTQNFWQAWDLTAAADLTCVPDLCWQ